MSKQRDLILAQVKSFDDRKQGRDRIVDEAVRKFMVRLDEGAGVARVDYDMATGSVEHYLVESLLKEAIPEAAPDDRRARSAQAAVLADAKAVLPQLRIHAPLPLTRLAHKSVALAGLIGGTAGMLLFGGISRLVLADPVMGLALGGPLGAWAFLRFILWLESNQKMRKAVQTALGLATFAEIYFMFAGPLAFLRGPSRGAFRRMGVYVAVFLFLTFVRREKVFPRQQIRDAVVSGVEAWLDGSLRLLSTLTADNAADVPVDERRAMTLLGERLQMLRATDDEDLPLAVEDLLRSAEDAGFEGLAGRLSAPPARSGADDASDAASSASDGVGEARDATLTWSAEMAAGYDCFGHIEEGDAVRVEREPLRRDGEVLRRGLVRRERGGDA